MLIPKQKYFITNITKKITEDKIFIIRSEVHFEVKNTVNCKQ